ncbi:MAG TPA: alpha/beta hydrolase [Acidimicrobiales bacterium]|nr:alpha/beta hydrolase [Acidimicrobiales bacterium]
MVSKSLSINGLDFNVIDEGEGTPVVLLHGFPDRGEMWRAQIDALSAAGYRAIAPDLRGFGDSAAPEGVERYGMLDLLGDVTGIMDALEVPKAHVVGHDWGAGLAWIAATFAPERVEKLVAVSVGHPTAFGSAGFEQRQRSWYMLAFQFVGIAEELVSREDFAFFTQWGEDGAFDRWRADLTRPGRLTAGLNWYRANVPPESLIRPPMELPPVTVPVMGVWSDQDGALGEAQMAGSAKYVAGEFRFERLDGVSHWIPTSAADRLNALLLDFLA